MAKIRARPATSSVRAGGVVIPDPFDCFVFGVIPETPEALSGIVPNAGACCDPSAKSNFLTASASRVTAAKLTNVPKTLMRWETSFMISDLSLLEAAAKARITDGLQDFPGAAHHPSSDLQ